MFLAFPKIKKYILKVKLSAEGKTNKKIIN